MNKCHLTKELSSYLDGQLASGERQRIEQHLSACAICSQELAQLKRLSSKLEAWQVPQEGAGFEAMLRDKIVAWELERSDEKMKKNTWIIMVPSGVLAAILLFVFVGQLRLRQGLPARMLESHSVSYVQNAALDKTWADEKIKEEAWLASSELSRVKAAGYDYSPWSLNKMELKPSEVSVDGPVIVIQPTLPATGEGEKIIRIAKVRLEVEDGNETYKKVSQICEEFGGYLSASDFYKDKEGRQSGTITMRIPKDKFLLALERLSQLGKVESSRTDSKDVSQQYANLKSHLDAAMVVYNKMMEALQKRKTTIPEAARLESEVTPVLQRIEDLKNQIEALNNAVSFTTIITDFHESVVSTKVLRESSRYIKESLLTVRINAVKFFAGAIPFLIIVFAGLVVIAIIALLAIILRKSFKS